MNIHKCDMDILIFNAFRYALGRSTYIVGVTVDIIEKYKDHIPEPTKALMIKEIHQAIDTGRAGMDIDVADWKDLLEVL